MLRNSGALSLLRGRLGVQVVVDNHTIDDSLHAQGWDVTKRSMCQQGSVTVQQLARWARKRTEVRANWAQIRIRKGRGRHSAIGTIRIGHSTATKPTQCVEKGWVFLAGTCILFTFFETISSIPTD